MNKGDSLLLWLANTQTLCSVMYSEVRAPEFELVAQEIHMMRLCL